MSKEVHRRGGCRAIEHLLQWCKPVLRQEAQDALFSLSIAGKTSRVVKRRVARLFATVSFDVMYVRELSDDS